LVLEPTSPYTPHIAYFDDTDDDLKHAWLTVAGWVSETVDSEGMVGAHAWLAVEPIVPYRLHIAYFDDSTKDLRHAWLVRVFRIDLPLALRNY
jgi:hypothetical protein